MTLISMMRPQGKSVSTFLLLERLSSIKDLISKRTTLENLRSRRSLMGIMRYSDDIRLTIFMVLMATLSRMVSSIWLRRPILPESLVIFLYTTSGTEISATITMIIRMPSEETAWRIRTMDVSRIMEGSTAVTSSTSTTNPHVLKTTRCVWIIMGPIRTVSKVEKGSLCTLLEVIASLPSREGIAGTKWSQIITTFHGMNKLQSTQRFQNSRLRWLLRRWQVGSARSDRSSGIISRRGLWLEDVIYS